MEKTDTAHLAWDYLWRTAEGREDWLEPERDVVDLIPRLVEAGMRDVLDLGCGVGRHSLLFAAEGFRVAALDRSAAGIDFLNREAKGAGLRVGAVTGSMTELPYPADRFDYVLAWNVIYHGDREVTERALAEIRRVLKTGGWLQATFLSKHNAGYGAGIPVARDTYRSAEPGEKAHPHYYCDGGGLMVLLSGFNIRSLVDREHEEPGSYHWHVLAKKK